jgi:hypothetical protein
VQPENLQGQTDTPIPPYPIPPPPTTAEPKTYKNGHWKILAFANVVTLVIPIIISLIAVLFIGGDSAGWIVVLISPLFLLGILTAIFNVMMISKYIIRNRPGKIKKFLGGLVVILSGFYLALFAYNYFAYPL